MNLRDILKRDIQHRRQQIADAEHLVAHWEQELRKLSTPLPRCGIDYAYGTPDLGRLKAAGNTFICRYLGEPASKVITRPEAQRLSHAGLDIVTVWETTADRALLAGRTGGAADAKMAKAQLHAAGAPPTAVVFFAVDFPADPQHVQLTRQYFHGAAQAIGREHVGVYGSYATVHELMSLDNIPYGWQTLAWSHGRWSPHAQLRQTSIEQHGYGIVYDQDVALAADFGQWRRT